MKRWGALSVEVPRNLEDEVAAALGVGTLGVEIVPVGTDRSRIRVYVGSPEGAARARARAEDVLRRVAGGTGARIRTETVPDGRWVERYQAALRPLPLGRRFLVVPGEPPGDPGGRETIRLIPGMAFGTGEHPTTRLCAAALERRVRPGSRWLDLGTGSGILAVVAVRCGAGSVLARDVDPDAVAVARDVLRANDAASRVDLREGSLDGLVGARLDGVVANLASEFFLSESGGIAAVLREGGWVLASGIPRGQEEDVSRSLREAGIQGEAIDREEGWVLLEGRRSGP